MTEEIKFEDETFEASDALTLDDLHGGYIGNPKVGDSVEFTIKSIRKLTGTDTIGRKADGTTFDKKLSKVDYSYEVLTTNNEKYTVTNWEQWIKMEAVFKNLKAINGNELRITHVMDGMVNKDKNVDNYKVEAKVEGIFVEMQKNKTFK